MEAWWKNAAQWLKESDSCEQRGGGMEPSTVDSKISDAMSWETCTRGNQFAVIHTKKNKKKKQQRKPKVGNLRKG